ncbi:MAG: hypothetical protein JW881_07800 [Spirochaetales bacterium]|nr:hypothetical protein [Spirochaetales bacterium]
MTDTVWKRTMYVCVMLMLFCVNLAALEKKEFLDAIQVYETRAFEDCVSIEFYEHGSVFIKTGGKLVTHYTIKKRYIYDFTEKKIYSKVIEFDLIAGKNRDGISAGDEKKETLKRLYELNRFFSMNWKTSSIDEKEGTIDFTATEWFVDFECHMNYDPATHFPTGITILTNKGLMEMSMAFSEHESFYLLDSFISRGTYNFLFQDHMVDIDMKRDGYRIITREDVSGQ